MDLPSVFRHRIRITWLLLRFIILLLIVSFLVGGSVVPPMGLSSLVRAHTRWIEFDFSTWTLGAVAEKLSSWGLKLNRFLTPQEQHQLVLDYLDQVREVQDLSLELLHLYTDPTVENPEETSQSLQKVLADEQQRLSALAPVAESILQAQLMDVLWENGLGWLGQIFPPSLYQTSDIPHSLIVSPRKEIRQVLDISLYPGLNADEMDQLEMIVLNELDYSALVVPVGGIGTYPTMVMQSADLVWLTEVIAHEWVHNYLTLRPLGMNYYTTEALRTINETTASLVGKEIGLMVLHKYYPAFVPPEADTSAGEKRVTEDAVEHDLETFDFQDEMHTTRVKADQLLAEGEVDAAEAYMESRREFFWENGYTIRKLNQAYFAFYGAYNDIPGGGAAGEDPVGPAVVAFRDRFESPADFLKAISRVNSFEELLHLLDV